MDGILIFCKDNVLRLQASFDDKEAIPLAFIQKFSGAEDDTLFMFDFLNHTVECEEGVTLANILIAISPWSPFLSRMLGIDLDAYLAEIRKPTELENDLDWIGITTVSLVARNTTAVRMNPMDNIDHLLNSVDDEVPDGFFMESNTKAFGYIKDDSNAYSIDCDIQTLKNLPVYIDKYHYVIDYQGEGNKQHLFNQRYPGVKKYPGTGRYIEVLQQCKFKALLEGLFRMGIYYPTPEISEIENANLDAISESFDEVDIQNELSLTKSKILKIVDELNQEELEDKETLSEKVFDQFIQQEELSDVLESFLNYFDARQEEWDSIKESCHHDDDFQIRIGQIKFAKLPQRFLIDKILPDN